MGIETDRQFIAEGERFKRMLPSLLETMPGHFVAMVEGDIVAHDLDLDIILPVIVKAQDSGPVFVRKVEPHEVCLSHE